MIVVIVGSVPLCTYKFCRECLPGFRTNVYLVLQIGSVAETLGSKSAVVVHNPAPLIHQEQSTIAGGPEQVDGGVCQVSLY